MTLLESERTQPWVSVTCGQCGDVFPLSTRNTLRIRSEGREPRCALCRRPPVVMSDEEREQFVVWWLYSSGLEVDELLEIAVVLGELA